MSEQKPDDAQRVQSFLNKEYYAIFTEPLGDWPDIQANHMPGHHSWLIDLEDRGILLSGGALFDPENADPSRRGARSMLIVRADSYEDAVAIAQSDPLAKGGHRSFTVKTYRVNEGSFSVTVKYSDQSMRLD